MVNNLALSINYVTFEAINELMSDRFVVVIEIPSQYNSKLEKTFPERKN